MKKLRLIGIMSAVMAAAVMLSACTANTPAISDKYRNYYEIFVSSFYDSNEDGYGDIAGVTEKLDYINDDLGADGIWLMPIMPSPTYHKYDVIDYQTIDPQYGSMEDFDALVAECNKRDIKLIIDMVLNHTSSQHEWFKSAVKSISIPDCDNDVCSEATLCSKHNPYCGYYNFSDKPEAGYHNIGMPQGYYYQGVFWDGMPDLNLDNQALRADIAEIGHYWLDKGVDGFRLDATTEFYDKNAAQNTEFLSWFYSEMQKIAPDVYMVGEAWTDAQTIAKYYQSGGIDSFFNFPYSQGTGTIVNTIRNQSGNRFAATVAQTQAEQGRIMANFFSNHDNGRSAGYMMNDLTDMKLAASLYMFMPGNSFIYYGEEIGMNGSGADENKRLPFLWSTKSEKGIPNPPQAATQTVDADVVIPLDQQLKDKNSLTNFYKQIIKIKQANPAIARGTVIAIDSGINELCVYKVDYDGDSVYVVHNLSDAEQQYALEGVKLAGALGAKVGTPKLKGGTLTLPPKSTAIAV